VLYGHGLTSPYEIPPLVPTGEQLALGFLIYLDTRSAYAKQEKYQPHPGIRDLPVRKPCSIRRRGCFLDYLGQM
jgi:hypothetical protein